MCAAASPAGPAPMTTKSNEGIEVSLQERCGRGPAVTRAASLAPRLVQEHGGRDRDVQAVGNAEHRQADRGDVLARPGVREARRLAAEHDGDRTPEVGLGVVDGAADAGREHANAGPAEPGEHLRARCAGHGNGEHRPLGRADGVGVEQVGPRVGGDHGVGAGAVGRPEHGPEVARLLDPLDDDDQRVRGQRQGLQRGVRDPGDRHDPVAAVAVGEPGPRRRTTRRRPPPRPRVPPRRRPSRPAPAGRDRRRPRRPRRRRRPPGPARGRRR